MRSTIEVHLWIIDHFTGPILGSTYLHEPLFRATTKSLTSLLSFSQEATLQGYHASKPWDLDGSTKENERKGRERESEGRVDGWLMYLKGLGGGMAYVPQEA